MIPAFARPMRLRAILPVACALACLASRPAAQLTAEGKTLDEIFDQTGPPVERGPGALARAGKEIARVGRQIKELSGQIERLDDIRRELVKADGSGAYREVEIRKEIQANGETRRGLVEARAKLILAKAELEKVHDPVSGSRPQPPRERLTGLSARLSQLEQAVDGIDLILGCLQDNPEALREWEARARRSQEDFRARNPGKPAPKEPAPPKAGDPERMKQVRDFSNKAEAALDAFDGQLKEARKQMDPDPEIEELLRRSRELRDKLKNIMDGAG